MWVEKDAFGGQSGGWAEGGKSKEETHAQSKLHWKEAGALSAGMEGGRR